MVFIKCLNKINMTVGEMPSHNHPNYIYSGGNLTGWLTGSSSDGNHIAYQSIANAGGDKYHNNIQPSKAIYRFRRTS